VPSTNTKENIYILFLTAISERCIREEERAVALIGAESVYRKNDDLPG